jgi:hypothetical protein
MIFNKLEDFQPMRERWFLDSQIKIAYYWRRLLAKREMERAH